MRRYYDTTCDGEKSPMVRDDYLRGLVCPFCDEALDEMLEEERC